MPPKRSAGRVPKSQINQKADSFDVYEKKRECSNLRNALFRSTVQQSAPDTFQSYQAYFPVEKSNDLEPFVRSVVVSLMFASGDAEHPLQENEDMVVDLLKNELVLLFDDVRAIHNVQQFKLVHFVSVLKSQKGILSRFLKYLENRVQMAAFMRSKTFSNQNICGQELDSDDEKVSGNIFFCFLRN